MIKWQLIFFRLSKTTVKSTKYDKLFQRNNKMIFKKSLTQKNEIPSKILKHPG